MKLNNNHLPANHQNIDDIPLEEDEIPYRKKKKRPVEVREVPVNEDNKRVFKATSSTEEGTVYTVKRLRTTAGTFVYKCECIGYQTRAKKNPFFMCKHIQAVKEYIGDEDN